METTKEISARTRVRRVEAETPREDLGKDIFSSTEFPPSEEIALHNENSYAMSWPRRLLFCCLVAPESGGSTPLADVRRVLERLPAPLVERSAATGWMLVRNDGSGFGLPWQTAWRPDDVLLVDNMLVAHGREPFRGERRVVVSMGDTRERAACIA